tara:strand:+ start:758 stop:1645 length:888 start_codon:yes stop_codon:yes gene_type:complete
MSQLNAGKVIASTGIEFPSYTESNKPTNLGTGATIYNSTNEELETWNGSEWMVIGGGSQPDGSSQDKAATNAAAILAVNPTASDGAYWINLPSVGPKQIYCAMSSNHLGGGGWMLAWKCTRGSTFGYNSNYWTSDNVYNETSGLNLNDGDHKNHAFNHYVASTIAAVFPDLNNGGQSSVPYSAWTWKQSGVGQTALSRLQSNQTLSTNPRGESSQSGSGFSNQNGYQWYGFNYTGNNSNRVRWGFGWNNEGDQGSNDVSGGIAPVRSGNSAGDHIYCCQGTTGVNRSIRAEIWVQ